MTRLPVKEDEACLGYGLNSSYFLTSVVCVFIGNDPVDYIYLFNNY